MVVVGVGYATAAWTPPTVAPPDVNIPAPINAVLNSQSKLGRLFINTDTVTPYAIGLSVFGKTILNGPVQITTGTPGLNKVLTDIDGTGNVGWRDGGGSSNIVFFGYVVDNPPSVPMNLSYTYSSFLSKIDISWDPSSDAEGSVASYRIYKDGLHIGNSDDTIYSISNYSSSAYFTISAKDAGGKESAQSDQLQVCLSKTSCR